MENRVKIPLNLLTEETPVCGIKKQSHTAELLRKAEFIVFDECTMMHKKAIEAVDRTLKDIRDEPSKAMGGITTLFSGDFRQTLPVIPKSTRANEIEACQKTLGFGRK